MSKWEYDKSTWPDGPWKTEPDRHTWIDKDTGYRCAIIRNVLGSLMGYVGVSGPHPLYMISYSHQYMMELEIHGDVVYTTFHKHLDFCFMPPKKSWWVGFDTLQESDYLPGYKPTKSQLRSTSKNIVSTYKDLSYMIGEVEFLAAQIYQYDEEGVNV